MSFDRNHDGKVDRTELAERMSGVVATGDTDGDEALSVAEVRAVASRRAKAPEVVAGIRQNGYTFADEAGQTSSMRLEGAIDDLRLSAAKRDKAIAVARAYLTTLEASAESELFTAMEKLLTPDQLAQFRTAFAARAEMPRFVVAPGFAGGQGRVFRGLQGGFDAFPLSPAERKEGLAALARHDARVRLGEEERLELARELDGVLTREENDNLRAALARRPVVAASGFAGQVRFVAPGAPVPDVKVQNLLLVVRDGPQSVAGTR
jgi:hypothetical protein